MIASEIGGPDRFVRFLRVLCLGGIEARLFGQVGAVVTITNRFAQRIDRARIHLHAVGSHIGDCAGLVERLCQPHGMTG